MKKIILFLIAAIAASSCTQTSKWQIDSPDSRIRLDFSLSDEGIPSYSASILKNGEWQIAIEASALGLTREDEDFSSGLKFISLAEDQINDSYTLAAGKKRSISYMANESVFTLENKNKERIEIIFRLLNDGFGFRYHFPEASTDTFTIISELSSFNLPDEGTCWGQPYDSISQYTPAYEKFFTKSMKIGTSAPSELNGWAFPMTFNTEDCWVLITESNLDGTYPASHLQPDCTNGIYTIRFPEESEAFGNYSNLPVSNLPWYTPWRLAIIGETAATIVESTIVTNFADPSEIDDISWIKPGRAAWSWWSDSPSPLYVKEQNRFTDLAVKMGWEYNLIDANWDQMKDGKVTDAINYAIAKNIGPILWYNSGGIHNDVTEAPRDRMWNPEIRANEFKMLADWGVKGVKVDFFQSDKQTIIQQYLGILKDAADNHILANFHGCTLPRGWNRTWPNMLTLEAVPGGEYYKFNEFYPETAPWQNTVLPFTRNAVGPMDYTPVLFSDHTYPHLTTYAHELATSVVFESGIIHMADKVEAYLGLPEEARQFLMHVPAAWDEIKFIDGIPGEFVILARRLGSEWYIAGLNGSNENRSFTIETGFLPEGNYSLRLIEDGTTSREFKFADREIKGGDELSISSLSYGGFAGIFTAE